MFLSHKGRRAEWTITEDPQNLVFWISPTRHNIPAGFFFNPIAFARPYVRAGQPIPSSKGAAIAGEPGTDIGSLGRNVLRGPRQSNVDFFGHGAIPGHWKVVKRAIERASSRVA